MPPSPTGSPKPSIIIGIDVGSVAIGIVALTPGGELCTQAYGFHQGQIDAMLTHMLSRFDLSGGATVAATGTAARRIAAAHRCDSRIALMAAAAHFFPRVGAILTVGGERFSVLHFDAQGHYHSFRTNTSCAAGTGSFLDQQARRLDLSGPAELSRLACENHANIPKIASRCAVFAKTDLAHAQQEGYTLAEICEGVCAGMARNIIDALCLDQHTRTPVVMTGGVALNRSLVEHLQKRLGLSIHVHPWAHLFGAIGAGLDLIQTDPSLAGPLITRTQDLVVHHRRLRSGPLRAPLTLQLSDYPDFGCHPCRHFTHAPASIRNPVEMDLYQTLPRGGRLRVYLGIDVGSTSTKCAVLGMDTQVLAGFYTRTAGRPVQAMRALMAAVAAWQDQYGSVLDICGTATTGAGRKFVGQIVGADAVFDEITAHARAAVALCPGVDTIIEIGGQDAKFTTLSEGRVTFSRMNHVCAAGTGSFIEEQARRLGCPLEDYPQRAGNRPAPVTSDRCTVFMERDINHYLGEGQAVDDLLASVLHSVRENYLTKVADRGIIGRKVVFQGATAKNRALVAAFEQYLKQPIHVSRYCHLTGAVGAALLLSEHPPAGSGFRGLDLCRRDIPIRSEVCVLCSNHCKLTVAQVNARAVAFGFLCGRDYDTHHPVRADRSGYDLLRERERCFRFDPHREVTTAPRVGLPAALHLFEDLPLWRKFFDELGVATVTSAGSKIALIEGKRLCGAEFCSPLAAFHGHVHQMMDKSDAVFAPFYLCHRLEQNGRPLNLCYYTQYAPLLARGAMEDAGPAKILTPLIYHLHDSMHTKTALFGCLKALWGRPVRFRQVAAAYDRALAFIAEARQRLRAQYQRFTADLDDIHVVLLGRPYTILSPEMNKQIPELFGRQGIRSFYQDMLPPRRTSLRVAARITEEIHWHYAWQVLSAAEAVAERPGAYPVMITSFKCAPDAFASDYFRLVMSAYGKPYLILQLDEHDSRVGYETRIEAAVHAFRNHFSGRRPSPKPQIVSFKAARRREIFQKTLFLPNWDPLSLRLIAAAMRREGIDARLLEERHTSIQRSLRHNNGQCIPLNVIAQDFIDTVDRCGMDPAYSLLWMPFSQIACNIRLYPMHIGRLIASHGRGFEKAGVYVGRFSFSDISLKLPIRAYLAYLLGGLLRKTVCCLRPYETIPGAADRAMTAALLRLEAAFVQGHSRDKAVGEAVALFSAVPIRKPAVARPKVAIFGDLYARDNEVFNQDLVRFIEANGGEVVTTPYSDYLRMVAGRYYHKWFQEGHYLDICSSRAFMAAATRLERSIYRKFEPLLGRPLPLYNDPARKILARFGVRPEHTGESMDNLLKVHYLSRHYPDLALFVQTSPSFCCPSLVTEAMARRIEKETGVPVVSITYDGTGGTKNDAIIPYLRYPRKDYVSLNPGRSIF